MMIGQKSWNKLDNVENNNNNTNGMMREKYRQLGRGGCAQQWHEEWELRDKQWDPAMTEHISNLTELQQTCSIKCQVSSYSLSHFQL